MNKILFALAIFLSVGNALGAGYQWTVTNNTQSPIKVTLLRQGSTREADMNNASILLAPGASNPIDAGVSSPTFGIRYCVSGVHVEGENVINAEKTFPPICSNKHVTIGYVIPPLAGGQVTSANLAITVNGLTF